MQRRNKFEMTAHNFSVNNKIHYPSWEHTIKTYQGNQTKVDWFLIISCLALAGFGFVAVWSII